LGSVRRVEPINRTFAPLAAFVEELARCGVTHAVTSPGSRNAPIALTLATQPGLEAVSVIDERSAGFVALGMAKAGRRPVAITCTSGSAAANLHPAVVEAWEARVPLIVLTADRPPELREVGAGQAIDQLRLYGSAAKWFVEVGTHDPGRETAIHFRALACRAFYTAGGGRPGPVHLNFALREPLAPSPEPLQPADWQGRDDGRPWTELREPGTALDPVPLPPGRGVVVCGPTAESVAEPVARFAARLGWPVLAEPTSGLRCGPHDRSHVVAHYDPLLRVPEFAERERAQVVVRVGDMPTSKPLRAWVAGARQFVLDPHAVWHEPTRRAELIVRSPAAVALEALQGERAAPDWLEAWRAADAAVPAALAEAPDRFEPKLLAGLEAELPDGAIVWVSSSMPIRDVEAHFPQSAKDLRFLANRGANGIDGIVSSALGAALITGRPTWLLTGELALVHDVGGLLAARRAGVELKVLCLDNGGGAIFDFLPLAEHADAELYERHIATPAGVDLSKVAPEVRVVRTDRRDNVRLHRELVERLAQTLS
jgi:2-succinyl-5-enolpyruvyl-6-hydroxy-3-cyclohexene-1-carboxylate synthase